ncbi:MAG TPA: hypothetical protein PKC67_15485 [Kiritimatiellia bacterium]|nr:hypothetical protein [Kiritimatiellia bacterium]HMP35737.1 hypothetical protein [Kiritimatiellia bacterium]
MNPTPIEHHRRHLAEWLAERALDHQLAEPPVPSTSAPPLRYDGAQSAPRPGGIHLARPSGPAWGPVYVLVLEIAESGVLVVPFGRYATPAVPGEWHSGIDAAPLRVLCGWNSRAVAAARLLPGAVKRVGVKALAEHRLLCEAVGAGVPPAAHLAERLGPPLVHPADPRYAYLDEERERLDDHFPVVREQDDSATPSRWLLAAEGRPRYGSGHGL